MDDASQSTWIDKETVDRLGIPIVRHGTYATSVAFSGTYAPPQKFPIAKIKLVQKNGRLFEMTAIVKDGTICNDLEEIKFVPGDEFSHLKDIHLETAYPHGPRKVNLLIGGDYYEQIRTGRRVLGQANEPSAVETLFGWVLGGPCRRLTTHARTSCNNIGVVPFEGLEPEFKKFYEAEQLELPSLPEDESQENSFRKEIKANMLFDQATKQYTVEIPYKPSVQKLEDNYGIAKALHTKQMKRLETQPEMKQKVKDIFDHQLQMGIIEEVTPDNNNPDTQKHYMPWHSVLRPGHPTTPIRNVMNASQKDSNGLSLNGCQETGPNLLPDVIGLAIQFRKNPVAVIADISKMFLNIKIKLEQRDLHRFIAFNKIFRQTTLLFGEASSPYLAMETVKKHAESMAQEFQLAKKLVENHLYMDDAIDGAGTTKEAIDLLKQLIAFFKSMHLELQKINSNDKAVLADLDPALLEHTANVTTVLGIEWDTVQDTLAPKPPPAKACATKRQVLSQLATIYDPLGLVAPVTCQGKIIMQKIWTLQLGWDDKIPPEIEKTVTTWIQSTSITPKVPRYYGPLAEIHIFCDASEDALAAAAYAVSHTHGSTLIMAKTRVRPTRPTTIPRLELQGAALAAKMGLFIAQYLGSHKTTFWTDSRVALGWIKSDSSKYKQFIGNRINAIQKATNKDDWMWVPTKENPADIPSRGIWPLNDQQMELWLKGPQFITDGGFPEQPPYYASPTEEIKKTAVHVVSAVVATPLVNVSRFSNLSKLLNATVYVFRFAGRKTPGRATTNKTPPNQDERKSALNFLIQQEQQFHFNEDITQLKEKGKLKKDSKLHSLNPTLQDGILMMHGRIQTEPKLVILPHKSHLSNLLIWDAHKRNLHSGASHTLNELRQKYWLIKGFATVKNIIKGCVTCKKAHNRLAEQQMAPLPEFRTTPSPPFTHVGVDYAGPLLVTKTGNTKRYILLFTCGVTRAIHLELTPTLEANDFMLAFHAFVSRRGTPSFIYSDNGTTFVAAAKMLPDIKWTFITPLSPWHGGFWERMVRSVKTPLRKIIGGARINETELRSLLTRVEATINSRPIGQIHGDDHRVLTPYDLLNGRPLQQMAVDPSPETSPSKRLQHLTMVHNQFWRQWRSEYLALLHTRQKWEKTKTNIKEGDIVLLLKEGAKRHEWPLAKVLEAKAGRDGLVRSIKLLCDQKEMNRPVQHVVPLEIPHDTQQIQA